MVTGVLGYSLVGLVGLGLFSLPRVRLNISPCALPPGDRPITSHPRSSRVRRLRLRLP
jgi:hypothetical protein